MQNKVISNKWYFLVLVAILLLGFFLRIHHLDQFSIAGDEFYTILVSNYVSQEGGLQPFLYNSFFTNKDWLPSDSVSHLMEAIARRDNGSGFFYYTALHYWVKIFGFEDWSLRFFSTFVQILLLIAIFYFGKVHLKSKKVGLLAAFLAASSPFLIAYSQVARTYSLVFLMILINSHFFLKCVKENPKLKYFLLWAFTALGALLSHYSTFVVFIFQGLFLLLFQFNNLKNHFKYFLLSGIIIVGGMLGWLVSPGGKYSFAAIEVSKNAYNLLLESGGGFEWLQKSNFQTISTQLWKVISMSNLLFDRFAFEVIGYKNYVITFFILVLSISLRKRITGNNRSTYVLLVDLLFSIFILNFVSNHAVSFLLLYYLGILVFTSWKSLIPQQVEEKYVIGIYLFSFICLVGFGIMDKNTMRIIPRYAGYSYAFGLLFISIFFLKIFLNHKEHRYLLAALIACLFYSNLELMKRFYGDKMEPYFYSNSIPRTKNQYIEVANKIKSSYAVGDTVIYPSFQYKNNTTAVGLPNYSVQVAQYINLYLHDSPKTIYQKVDTTNLDKVFLKSSSKKMVLIHQFTNPVYLKDW
jgi:uncharacterized membrane protein